MTAQPEQSDEIESFKAAFLSLMSHELRAPLQTINGYLDLALAGLGGELNTQQAEFVRRARAGGERMVALVDNLILLARHNAGKLSLAKQDLDLADLVRETVEEAQPLAEEASVRIRMRLPANAPQVYADASRVAQAVRNLLLNALAFSPVGGVVSITLGRAMGVFVLTIRDSGTGIAIDEQEKVFEAFFRGSVPAESAGCERPRGLGIGLTCARIIAEGHGGAMRLQSIPGKGTTASLSLPGATSLAPARNSVCW